MASSEKTIRVDRRESFALVTLDQEAKLNALSSAMVDDLLSTFAELQSDIAVRAVILTGSQSVFAASDAEELAAASPEQIRALAIKRQSLTALIENFGKPVIAAINGLASGSGCDLALACAWRMASPDATFDFSEASSSIGGSVRLAKVIGKSRALEVLLVGKPISADEALRIGLINRVANSAEALLTICEEMARQISRNAPLAIKHAMESVNHGSELPLSDGLRLESALFGLCFATADVQEGTKAFAEKRPPNFIGR
jgi:enoyl-CoA hydratase